MKDAASRNRPRPARPKRTPTWLADRLRAITNRLFQGPDERARQYGWTVEVKHGGMSRRYRDPRFDSLRPQQ